MAYVEDKTYIRRMSALNDYQARDLAAQRLDELEARLQHEIQRRGLQPVTTDTGAVIAWVRTR